MSEDRLQTVADRSYMFGRSRLWWFVRMVRIYHKHRVPRFNGLRRTWQDAGVAARAMKEKP